MRRKGWLRLPRRRLAPRPVAASVGIAAGIVLAVAPFLLVIIASPDRVAAMATILTFHIAIMLVWSAAYLGYHYLESACAAEAAKWRLELAMRDTELGALRAQLNPHFLFNSLNSLRGLVTEDPERAQEAIKHGVARLPEGGVVRIEARKMSDDLHIRVTNTGTLTERRSPGGIGLRNALERLRLTFGDRVSLDLQSWDQPEVTCIVVVPAPAAQPAPSGRTWEGYRNAMRALIIYVRSMAATRSRSPAAAPACSGSC